MVKKANDTAKSIAAVNPGAAVSAERVRVSQSEIPAYSLEQALRVPRAIADNYNLKPTSSLNVAAAMNFGPTTGPFRMITGAAVAYGLTNGGGQSPQIELTPLAVRILRPKKEGDDQVAMREAFVKPRVINQFLRQYDNGAIPRRDIAINVLTQDMAVPEKRAEAVLDMILEGARSLKLIKKIKDKEYVSLEVAGVSPSEEETYDPDEATELDADVKDEKTFTTEVNTTTAHRNVQEAVEETNKRVFITHGKNKDLIEPIKKLISYGKYLPVVAVERTSVSKPMPDKVMGMMRSCGAAIIHVDVEQTITDRSGNDHLILNPNVLIEIGAAQALYGRRFVLLVREGVKLPSNLQGLSEVRYSGEKMDSDVTLALLDALQDIQNYELPDRYKANQDGKAD